MPPKQAAVDVMSCGKTDRDVIDLVLATLPQFGLHPFEARRESTGFIFNRVWAAVKRESLEVVADGVSAPQEVDQMFAINTGSAAGPFRMMDRVGLDVVLDIEEHYCAEHPEYPDGHYGLVAFNHDTAIVEIANTCGLATLPGGVLAPMTASSYGFGEAIRATLTLSRHRLVLALGGSASTDGGIGLLAALGYRFLDRSGALLAPTSENLNLVHRVDADQAVDLTGIRLIVAGDVTSPLRGMTGAAAVFGPQKGATAAQIAQLDDSLQNLVSAFTRSGFETAETFAHTSGAGAAGGIGFAAMLLGAITASGAHYFLNLLNFDDLAANADLVITGEGRLDHQTLQGKLPAAVALRAAPTRAIAVVGRNDLDCDAASTQFADVFALADLTDSDTSRDPHRTAELLLHIGTQIGVRYATQS